MDSFVAGASAGLVVDLTLYPIDTIKTRLQSKNGFQRSGGFRGVYRGLSAVAAGSVPGGAAFFLGYDLTKRYLLPESPSSSSSSSSSSGKWGVDWWRVLALALSAMAGETAACLTRVPTEMVKQQMQAGHHHSIRRALIHITHHTSNQKMASTDTMGPSSIHWRGLPRLFVGMPVMLLRELPFAVLQMSCYETLKRTFGTDARPHFLPICGAISGGTAALLTTPLDLLKTRIMLGQVEGHTRGWRAVREAFRQLRHEAPRATDRWGPQQKFFRGAVPRVIWISIGGSVFFTTYETVRVGYHYWSRGGREKGMLKR